MNRADLSDREERIRALAHRLWEDAGRPEGQDERFWHEAEAEIDRAGEPPSRDRLPPDRNY